MKASEWGFGVFLSKSAKRYDFIAGEFSPSHELEVYSFQEYTGELVLPTTYDQNRQ